MPRKTHPEKGGWERAGRPWWYSEDDRLGPSGAFSTDRFLRVEQVKWTNCVKASLVTDFLEGFRQL